MADALLEKTIVSIGISTIPDGSLQAVGEVLKFDDTSHSFCFPNVPAGYPVRIVSVAKLDTAYWLGAATTETGTNSTLALQPQQKEALDLLGYLRGL